MTYARATTSRWEVFLRVLTGVLVGLAGSLIILATPRSKTPKDVPPPVFVAAPPPAVTPPTSAAPPPRREEPAATVPPTRVGAAVTDLRNHNLLVPVEGVSRAKLVDSFDDARDRTRQHEALDILAPRGTPVLAVEAGTIEKLFTSVRGGLTIYQFDPTGTYTYYYAHLDRYAAGLSEHRRVERGQLIGFVGTTGNAPKTTPHLHFSIFLMTDKKQWWDGTALNPYDVWR